MLKLMFPLLLMLLLLFMKKPSPLPMMFFMLTIIMTSSLLPAQSSNPITLCLTYTHLSSPLIMLTLWISGLMISISLPTLLPTPKMQSLPLLTLILSALLVLCFSVNNFLLFYIFFEASLIPTLFLILLWGYQPDRLHASTYMIMYTITASLPLLLGLLLMYLKNLHLNMLALMWLQPSILPPTYWWTISSIAFLVKMPLYSLHLWLPKAHVEAPTAGSMILASILLKLGSYGLIRLTTMIFIPSTFIPLILSLSMWGATLTSLICIRQTDVKALIAYSSVAHMALMITGLMSLTSWGWNGALTIMLAHGLCSPALFALAAITQESSNTRSLFLTKGLLTMMPTMTMWWFLFSAVNMAAPPSMNLLGEILLMTATLSKSLILMPLIASTAFLTAVYNLHLYTATQHGPTPQFSNPTLPPYSTHLSSLLLHFAPLFLLMMKPELIAPWV